MIDLCAAPGGWSQVISECLQDKGHIVAVDVVEMADIENVVQIQGDITAQTTVDKVLKAFTGKKAELIVSDGAPDVLGLHDMDEFLQAQLVLAALNISLHLLANGGTFVAKIFRGKQVSLLYAALSRFFKTVTCAKPQACRNSSVEAFVVCTGFELPKDFTLRKMDGNNPFVDGVYDEVHHSIIGPGSFTVPFVACYSQEDYDADMSYPIWSAVDGTEYVHRAPLQLPINPPYAKAVQTVHQQLNR